MAIGRTAGITAAIALIVYVGLMGAVVDVLLGPEFDSCEHLSYLVAESLNGRKLVDTSEGK